jgi:UDP-2-acetamido-3-amino-2,3-dideoxy-glucuronate N-acetyltransferase
MDKQYYVHPSAEVSPRATIGRGTKIWNLVQIRESAIIGEDCVLSKDVYIDAGVRIGSGVKVENGVSIYHGVTVEDDVFLGPHMVFTNDMYPRSFSTDWTVSETVVRRGASIGANATIVCGTTLGEYCMVGAGAVVTRNVPAHALVLGNPAYIHGAVCKCGTPLRSKHRQAQTTLYVCPRCGATTELLPEVQAEVED